MGTDSLTPAEAFAVSQPRQPWFAGRWSPSMFDWLHEVTPSVSRRENLVISISNLYEQTLNKPGRDYRLGWFPHFKDIFRLCTGQVEDPTQEQIKDWISKYSQNHLLSIAPYSAEEIKEEVAELWCGRVGYHKSLDIGRLFANPNADPDWISEEWDQYVSKDITETLDFSTALNIFDGIAKNPRISDELVRKIVKFSHDHNLMPLRYLLWNPALTAETFVEVLPSRVRTPNQDPRNSRDLLWHGNVPTFGSGSRSLPGKGLAGEPLAMSQDLEASNRETYNALTEITGWVAGRDNPVGYTRPDLICGRDLQGFLKTPWTNEVHMRELDEIVYCEKYSVLRRDISRAMISIYSADPSKNSEFSGLSKSLNFLAAHFARLDELDTAMGAEVPKEWLLELL